MTLSSVTSVAIGSGKFRPSLAGGSFGTSALGKLKRFHENDLGNRNITNEHRIYWYFEDVMKERFNAFINIVENGLSGTLPYFKRACLNAIYRLLDEKPEGEGRLLRILINKLGDPDHQIASKVVYLLQQILGHHPMMKEPVVKAVEELLYRPNIAIKSQYTVNTVYSKGITMMTSC